MKKHKNSNFLDNLDKKELSKKIIKLTERAGGRSKAAEIMGISPTTLDNYRLGNTQPRFLEVLKLLTAADEKMDYILPARYSDTLNFPIDLMRLSAAVSAVETGLRERNIALSPEKYGEVVMLSYQMLDDETEVKIDESNIIRLFGSQKS